MYPDMSQYLFVHLDASLPLFYYSSVYVKNCKPYHDGIDEVLKCLNSNTTISIRLQDQSIRIQYSCKRG